MSVTSALIGLIVRTFVLGILFRISGKFVARMQISYSDSFRVMGITAAITQLISYMFMFMYMRAVYRDDDYYQGVAFISGLVFSYIGVWIAAAAYTSKKTGNRVGGFVGFLISLWMVVIQAFFIGCVAVAVRVS